MMLEVLAQFRWMFICLSLGQNHIHGEQSTNGVRLLQLKNVIEEQQETIDEMKKFTEKITNKIGKVVTILRI